MSELAERIPHVLDEEVQNTEPLEVPEEIEAVLSEIENVTLIEALVKKNERKAKRRGRLPIKLAAVAITLQSLWAGYNLDVAANKEEASESQPTTRTLSQEYASISKDSTTFYLAGFDTRNGDAFGNKVGIALHQIIPSQAESIDYGNAPLDHKEIAEKIISAAQEQGLASISLAGNSLGGFIAAQVAEYIILNSHIEVEAIILNSTPDGPENLRPGTQDELAMMIQVFEQLEGIDAKYSTLARIALTVIQENGRYINKDNPVDAAFALFDTIANADQRIRENRVPGAWLATEQASAVAGIDLEETLMKIGEQRGEKRMPIVLYLRPTDAKDDVVVDVETSGNNTCEYAENADISCTIVKVDGALHTSYLFNTEKYVEAIGEQSEGIKQDIADEDEAYALVQQDEWAALNVLADQE